MPELVPSLSLKVNGVLLTVTPGTTVAAAILMTGSSTRRSVIGESRGPLCAMGVCFECQVIIDGTPQQRSCQILCVEGMDVRTS